MAKNSKQMTDSRIWAFIDLYVGTEAGQWHPLYHHMHPIEKQKV